MRYGASPQILVTNVSEWDGPAVLRPCQQAKLEKGAEDEEHAM